VCHRRFPVATVILVAMLYGVGPRILGQTVPDDSLPDAKTPIGRSERQTVGPAESVGRAKQAQRLLRAGEVASAEALVSGANFVLPSNADPRDGAFVRGLASYQKGELRAAYDLAGSIHHVGKSGNVNLDAAMLKSLVYLQSGVYPLAEKWARWILEVRPDHLGARGILEALATRQALGYQLQQTIQSDVAAGYEVSVWEGPETSTQPLLLCLKKGTDFLGFRGAVALEQPTLPGATDAEYVLRFYDLEAPPLVLARFGKRPSTDEVLARVKGFDPRHGASRYTCMRARLETQAWQGAGVLPYASQWESYARPMDAARDESVAEPARAGRGSWQLESKELAYLPDSQEPVELCTYVNLDLTRSSAWAEEHGPLTHAQVVVLSLSGDYLASFTVDSIEPVPDERVYFLDMLAGGARQPVKRYDDLVPPGLQQVADDARQALKQLRTPGREDTVSQALLAEYAAAKKAYRDAQSGEEPAPTDQLAVLKQRFDNAARKLTEANRDARMGNISELVRETLKQTSQAVAASGLVRDEGACIAPQFVEAMMRVARAKAEAERLENQRRIAQQRELAARRRAADEAELQRMSEYDLRQEEHSHAGL
jgi:hypothetical protein